MRATEEEEVIEHLRTLLLSNSAILNRSEQEEVDSFNELRQKYIDYAFPDTKEKRQKKEQEFMQTFDSIFKNRKPQELQATAGEVSEGEINDVLKAYREGTNN